MHHEVVSAGEAVRGVYEHGSASGVDELEVGQIQVDFLVMARRLPQCVAQALWLRIWPMLLAEADKSEWAIRSTAGCGGVSTRVLETREGLGWATEISTISYVEIHKFVRDVNC